MNYIKNSKTVLLSVMISILLIGCGDFENDEQNVIGSNFVEASVIDDINATTMLAIVKANIDSSATNAFAYKAVKIKYKTLNEQDKEILASGLLVIPSATSAYKEYLKSLGKSFTISMILDQHGTIFKDSNAPSKLEVNDGIPNYPLAISMTAYAGFAAAFPDYIGYADSKEENHPYMLRKSSARSSLDMLRASIRYMTDAQVLYNGQVYISGYSQGGYNALALAKDIEENHSSEFKVKAIAAMATPAVLTQLADGIIKTDGIMVIPAFMAYIAESYAKAYDNLSLEEMIENTKEAAFLTLFDGTKDSTGVHTALQLAPRSASTLLFENQFIDEYSADSSHKLKQRFEENDIVKWKSTSKIKLIHCNNDEVIPIAMSNSAKLYLEQNGSTSVDAVHEITSVTAASGETVHGNCGASAYAIALAWFTKIRAGEIK